jgi:DNA-binding protein HU-beta
MNKTEFIEALVEATGQTKSVCSDFLSKFEEIVTNEVKKGNKVTLTGFLAFEKRERAARTASNPQTGEAISVKAASVPKVSIGAAFKKAIKG